MSATCPTCGHAITRDFAPASLPCPTEVTGQQVVILDALIAAWPRDVTMARLIDLLYGDDPDGGPDDPGRVVRVQVHRMKAWMQSYGWTIRNRYGFGYRLERLP